VLRAGPREIPVHRRGDALVRLVDPPVGVLDVPVAVRVLLGLLESFSERLPGQSQPVFQDERSVVDEHLLEAPRVIHAPLEGGVADFVAQQRADVGDRPGAEGDADPARRRQCVPEAPHAGALPLLLGGVLEDAHPDVAGIEPLQEPVGDPAHPPAVVPGDDDQDRKAGVAQLELGVEEVHPELRHPCGEFLLADRLLAHLQHRHRALLVSRSHACRRRCR
jgi:hypothetical protein